MKDRPGPSRTQPPAAGSGSPEFQASLIRAIHEASPDGILVVDEHNMVVSLNHRMLEVWKIPENWAQADSHREAGVLGPDARLLPRAVKKVKDEEAFLKRIEELYADPNLDDHCEIEMKDGRTLERHSTVLWAEDGRYLGRVWFFRDITAHKRLEATLTELACTDPLTGVSNRRHFFERAAEEFARARRSERALSVALLDLDRFKSINDEHGHAAGDAVLKALANGWTEILREVDVLARIGGEEFVAMMPDTALEGAATAAERFRDFAARHTVSLDGVDVRCTVSVGVAMLHDDDASIDQCLRRADEALYRAKQGGRSRVELTP